MSSAYVALLCRLRSHFEVLISSNFLLSPTVVESFHLGTVAERFISVLVLLREIVSSRT